MLAAVSGVRDTGEAGEWTVRSAVPVALLCGVKDAARLDEADAVVRPEWTVVVVRVIADLRPGPGLGRGGIAHVAEAEAWGLPADARERLAPKPAGQRDVNPAVVHQHVRASVVAPDRRQDVARLVAGRVIAAARPTRAQDLATGWKRRSVSPGKRSTRTLSTGARSLIPGRRPDHNRA